jgi:RNAse H domain protein, YqgF family
MARIVALDVGKKRTGIAVTDPQQVIASGLCVQSTLEVVNYLKRYLAANPVEKFVVGLPTTVHGEPSESMQYVVMLVKQLERTFPELPIEMHDERFTSHLAQQAILESGAKKKQRQDKGLVDMVSAVIILQSYLEMQAWNKTRR